MQLSFIRGNFLANRVLGEDKHPINQKNVKSTTNKTENLNNIASFLYLIESCTNWLKFYEECLDET